MKKELCTIILLVALAFTANAQVVYTCDFENTTQNQQWELNRAASSQISRLVNKWYIGAPGQSGTAGSNGLYISNDGGVTADYLSTAINWTVAYVPMTLPAGTYTVNFDWKMMGVSQEDGLYVMWLPANQTTNSAHGTGSSLPTWVNTQNHLHGSSSWSPTSVNIAVTSANSNGKLVFVWHNVANANKESFSACVDNIEVISLLSACPKPTNIQYNAKTGVISWQGSSSTYDLRIINSFTGDVQTITGLQTSSYTLQATDEGYMYFYVRGVCSDGGKSEWEHSGALVYHVGERCLDYMDLDAANCYYGPFDNPTNSTFTRRGKIDLGYANVGSHHTIHYLKDERDPRTENRLRTIPEDEIASVRLGNWTADAAINGQGASEAIEYKYKVQAGSSDILVLKYAIVMELPGHNDGTDPYFNLEILNSKGRPLTNDGCTQFHFAAATNDPAALVGWNHVNPGSYDEVIWKDWTTMYVSLRDYIGQTLTLRFTTKDCRQSAHYAYAYFTISCMKGDFEGLSCGDTSTDHFTAPIGFKYKWYLDNDPNHTRLPGTSDTTRVFHIDPMDTTVYRVELTPLDGLSNCGYSLVANPNPRFPQTEVTWKRRTGKCENVIDFTNTSYVAFMNRETGVPMADRDTTGLDYVYINFGDNTDIITLDRLITHQYPDTGGTFTIRLRSSMSDDVCVDSLTYEITLPNILEDRWLDTIHLCEADVYTAYDKRRITKDLAKMQVLGVGDTVYNFLDTLGGEFNEYNCEIDQYQPVRFHKEFHSYKEDTLCLGKSYQWGDKSYTEAGKDIQYKLTSVYGCDSIAHLDLYVRPRLKTNAWPLYACSGDEVMLISTDLKDQVYDDIRLLESSKYEGKPGVMAFTRGASDPKTWYNQYTGLHVYTDSLAQADGFAAEYFFKPGADWVIDMPREKMRPATYHFKFVTETNCNCADSAYEKVVEIRYGYEAVDASQGYISTTGPRYNGGYDLETNKVFQWYRDAEPILDGGDDYYLKTKWESDINHVYFCVITDTITGEITTTCPIEYGSSMDVNHDDPRVGLEYVQANHTYRVYNILGYLVGVYTGEAIRAMATSPRESAELRGLYILVCEDAKSIEDANATIKILIP